MSDRAILILISLVSLAAGCGCLFYIWWTRMLAKASLQWPVVDGAITFAEVATNRGKGGTRHSVSVKYKYQVADETLEGNRIAWEAKAARDRAAAEAQLKTFPVGGQVQVHYDPRKPSRSVLAPAELGLFYTIVNVTLGVAFAAIGLVGLYAAATS